MEYLIQIVAGLVTGNATGAAARNLSLGTIGNSIAGAIGGLGGGQIVDMFMNTAESTGFDFASLLGGGAGGIVLTAIAGAVKNMMAKS